MLEIHKKIIDDHNDFIVSDPRKFYKFNIHALHDDNTFIIDRIEKQDEQYIIIPRLFSVFMEYNIIDNIKDFKSHIIITFLLPETQKNISLRCDIYYGDKLHVYQNNNQSNVYGNTEILNDTKKNQEAFKEFKRLFADSPEKFKNIKAYINFSEEEFSELKQKVKDIAYDKIPYDIYDNYAYKFTKNIMECQDNQNNLDISKIKSMNVGDCIKFVSGQKRIDEYQFEPEYRNLYVANLEPFILLELVPIQPNQLFRTITESLSIETGQVFKKYFEIYRPYSVPINDTLVYQDKNSIVFLPSYNNKYEIKFKNIDGTSNIRNPFVMTYKMFTGEISELERMALPYTFKVEIPDSIINSIAQPLNLAVSQLDIFKHQYLSPEIDPILIPCTVDISFFSKNIVPLYFYTTNLKVNEKLSGINLNRNILTLNFRYANDSSNSNLVPNNIINLPYIHVFK